MRISLLRYRPYSQKTQGLAPNALTRMARKVSPGCVHSQGEFIAPEDESRDSTPLTALIGDLMASDVLIVDKSYQPGTRPFVPSHLLAEAFRGWAKKNGLPQVPVIIIDQTIPDADSELYALSWEPGWKDWLAFIAISDEIRKSTDDETNRGAQAKVITDRVANALKPEKKAVTDFFFRTRGVFKVNTGTFFDFHYTTDGYDDHERLGDAIAVYLVDEEVRVVVVDSKMTGAWFGKSVLSSLRAARLFGSEILLLDSADYSPSLEPLPESTDRWTSSWAAKQAVALEVFRADPAKARFIVPALDHARSLRKLRAKFEAKSQTRSLAVLLNSELLKRSGKTITKDVKRALVTPRSSGSGSAQPLMLDYLASVEIRGFGFENWRVDVADILGEIRELPSQATDFSEDDSVVDSGGAQGVFAEHGGTLVDRPYLGIPTSAMWSLYEDCGVGVEGTVPRRRPPVARFPQLSTMPDWDAHWLAEAAVLEFEKRLGKARGDFLVVLPGEGSAARKVSQAMARRCNVHVMPIPRKLINKKQGLPPEFCNEILGRREADVVVFDESTITGGTLLSLGEKVKDVTGAPPVAVGMILNLAGIDVNLSEPLKAKFSASLEVFAFQRWAPLRYLQGGEVVTDLDGKIPKNPRAGREGTLVEGENEDNLRLALACAIKGTNGAMEEMLLEQLWYLNIPAKVGLSHPPTTPSEEGAGLSQHDGGGQTIHYGPRYDLSGADLQQSTVASHHVNLEGNTGARLAPKHS